MESGDKCFNNVTTSLFIYLFIYFLPCFISLYTRSNHPSTEFCQRLSISFQIISKNWYYKFCVSLRGIPFSSYSFEKNIPRIL